MFVSFRDCIEEPLNMVFREPVGPTSRSSRTVDSADSGAASLLSRPQQPLPFERIQ